MSNAASDMVADNSNSNDVNNSSDSLDIHGTNDSGTGTKPAFYLAAKMMPSSVINLKNYKACEPPFIILYFLLLECEYSYVRSGEQLGTFPRGLCSNLNQL